MPRKTPHKSLQPEAPQIKARKPKGPHKPRLPDKSLCKRCREIAAAPNPRVPLNNPLREKFCQNVALGGMTNQKAYLAAFTSRNATTASSAGTKLRRNIEVENRIITLTERAIENDLKTRDWVDDQLKEVVNRCMQKEPVTEQGKKKKDPCPTCHGHRGEWRFDARGANTALHLMGKDRGMFVDKLQIVDDELSKKSPAEIREVIKAGAIELGRDFIKQLGESVGLFEASVPAPNAEVTETLQ